MSTTTDRIYDLSQIWASAKEVFPYFDRLESDWDEKYYKVIERLLDGCDEAEFHKLLSDFVAFLNDGHTKYIPPDGYRETKAVVRPEAPTYSVENMILTIKINEFLTDHAQFVKDTLNANPECKLVRLDIRDNIGGNTAYAAKVAELFISGVFHGCQKWTQVRKAIDIASASQIVCSSEEKLQKYIKDGLLDEEELSNSKRVANRTNYELYTDTFGEENNVAVYNGSLELLISGRTISVAEDFAAMFRSNHRAALIGEPTAGTTGTPCIIKLRCGGRAQIVSVGYRLLDGTEFIGKGIETDVYEK